MYSEAVTEICSDDGMACNDEDSVRNRRKKLLDLRGQFRVMCWLCDSLINQMMVYPDQMPSHPEQFDCYCNPVTQNETYVVADVIMSVMEVRVLKLNCATPVLLRTLCEHHHSTIVPRSLNVLSFPITARIGILAINLSLAQCKMTELQTVWTWSPTHQPPLDSINRYYIIFKNAK